MYQYWFIYCDKYTWLKIEKIRCEAYGNSGLFGGLFWSSKTISKMGKKVNKHKELGPEITFQASWEIAMLWRGIGYGRTMVLFELSWESHLRKCVGKNGPPLSHPDWWVTLDVLEWEIST